MRASVKPWQASEQKAPQTPDAGEAVDPAAAQLLQFDDGVAVLQAQAQDEAEADWRAHGGQQSGSAASPARQ